MRKIPVANGLLREYRNMLIDALRKTNEHKSVKIDSDGQIRIIEYDGEIIRINLHAYILLDEEDSENVNQE